MEKDAHPHTRSPRGGAYSRIPPHPRRTSALSVAMAVWRRFLMLFVALLVVATTSWTAGVHGDDAVESAASVHPQAKTNHILVDTEEEADEIKAELETSERILVSFARVAKTKSKCPSGPKGGSLGWIERGKMVPEFDAVVFNQPPNKLYKVKTQFGWHVVYTIRLGNGPQDENPDDGSWSYTFKVWFTRATPFISPLLLIGIFVWGSSRSISGGGPRARASHILVKTEAQADALLAQVQASADKAKTLGELAKAHSSCPSKSKGGDLGMFGKGQMVPAFEKVAFEQAVGSVHKVQTQVRGGDCMKRYGGETDWGLVCGVTAVWLARDLRERAYRRQEEAGRRCQGPEEEELVVTTVAGPDGGEEKERKRDCSFSYEDFLHLFGHEVVFPT
jgi:peptidyl-prolyl cis-trans isomerase C